MRRGQLGRWAIVAALIAILAALPYAVSRLPAAGSGIGAAQLLSRVQGSGSVGYSGYGEATGSLALPVTSGQFSSVADLFGSTTQLRVWWRGSQDWRVDEVSPSGEQDLHAQGSDLWSWNFESNTAELDHSAAAVQARLPRADDLVPASLARRLLSQAQPGEVTRIASRRIAGADVAGLRYTPSAAQSTIGRVDIWALPDSGLPVAVSVYDKSDPNDAVVTAGMLDLSTARPSATSTAFTPPPTAKISTEQAPDILSLANRIGVVGIPDQLGGLERDSISPASSNVTVYGEGVTVLVAIPIFGRTGDQLRQELAKAVGSTTTQQGTAASVGPVNLLLAPQRVTSGNQFPRGLSWLLVGTVQPATLLQAQTQLAAKGI